MQENNATMNATLVQTIFLPITLEYRNNMTNGQWNKRPYIEHNDEKINFYKGCISTLNGSFLFFNSILSKKNYSLTKEEEAQKYFLEVQKVENNDLKEQREKKEFEESVEYKEALKAYDFSNTLEMYIFMTGGLSLLLLIGCIAEYCESYCLSEESFVSSGLRSWTASIAFASIIIGILESNHQKNLEKNFPGIREISYNNKFLT